MLVVVVMSYNYFKKINRVILEKEHIFKEHTNRYDDRLRNLTISHESELAREKRDYETKLKQLEIEYNKSLEDVDKLRTTEFGEFELQFNKTLEEKVLELKSECTKSVQEKADELGKKHLENIEKINREHLTKVNTARDEFKTNNELLCDYLDSIPPQANLKSICPSFFGDIQDTTNRKVKSSGEEGVFRALSSVFLPQDTNKKRLVMSHDFDNDGKYLQTKIYRLVYDPTTQSNAQLQGVITPRFKVESVDHMGTGDGNMELKFINRPSSVPEGKTTLSFEMLKNTLSPSNITSPKAILKVIGVYKGTSGSNDVEVPLYSFNAIANNNDISDPNLSMTDMPENGSVMVNLLLPNVTKLPDRIILNADTNMGKFTIQKLEINDIEYYPQQYLNSVPEFNKSISIFHNQPKVFLNVTKMFWFMNKNGPIFTDEIFTYTDNKGLYNKAKNPLSLPYWNK